MSTVTQDLINKKEALKFLGIPEKNFENYRKFSEEIKGVKYKTRWYFNKNDLARWKKVKESRTIFLNINKYEECFEFAIKMVYGGLSLNGIRGQRSEMQAADDIILGILAEHAVKQFLEEKFSTKIKLDESVHPGEITPQDVNQIEVDNIFRQPKIGVAIKASKMKNAFLVLGTDEVEKPKRKSDVYIFARVGLPSDHLFRFLRDHSFFSKVKDFTETNKKFKKIEKLENIPVWICGFSYLNELEKKKKIPSQKFDGKRYTKSVSKLHNADEDWRELIAKL